MPKWINGKYLLPTELGKYFVKVDGRREILSLQQIEKDVNYYGELLWLDEKGDDKDIVDKINSIKSIDEFVKLKFYDANKFITDKKRKSTSSTLTKNETAIKTIHSIVELNKINFQQIKSLENLFGVKFKKFKKR